MEYAQLMIWVAVLVAALFSLIRGADLFLVGAKQVGVTLGMNPFIIGVLIVGFGTSVPELASSIAAVLQGSTEIVIANVVGSNITNILLIAGLLAAIGGPIAIQRDLIKTELPIFFITTIHFLFIIMDGVVDRLEGFLILGTFFAYLWYLFSEPNEAVMHELETAQPRPRVSLRSIVFIVLGLTAVLVGAKFTVDMVINIATGLSVPLGLVSILAIAIGTSLPELFVSLQALRNNEGELAIGNLFGSNAFNIMLVIGIPSVITPLFADEVVMQLGLGIFIAASLIFFVNGLARQMMRWEGVMMLIFFVFFLAKLTEFM